MTYTPGDREPESREVNWDKLARDVFFQIRSWCGIRGVPRGAFGAIDGQRVLITRTKPVKNFVTSNGAPSGIILSREDGEILLQCADGPLRILDWHVQAEGVHDE